MTAPETDDITPPSDPATFAHRRPGIGIAAIAALCVICVILGFAGAQASRLFTGGQAEPAPGPAVATPMAELPMPTPTGPLAGAPASAPSPAVATAPDVGAFESRLAQLETSQRRAMSAAGAALAASTLAEAAQTSQPFEAELAALEQVLPLSAEARALRPLAESGVPSRAALAAEYSNVAARASVAARAPGEGAGVFDRLLYGLSAVVTVRRVGSTTGNRPDAVLARAERQVAEGDLAGAVSTLRQLPPKAAEAFDPWRARALQRLSLDRALSAIRAQALADLTSAGGARP